MERMLVVEKYTSYEYTLKNGNKGGISDERLADLQRSHDDHVRVKEFALGLLEKNGVSYDVVRDSDVLNVDFSVIYGVMSLGGDGTVTRASAYVKDQLFFGVNSDLSKSVGKLARLNKDNLEETLGRVLNGDERIEEWSRLSARVNGVKQNYVALNEILVSNKSIYRTSHLEVEVGDNVSKIVSNGIVVSTRQGSTAFFKSSGGSTFDVEAIGYNAVMPYSIEGSLQRSGIVGIDEKIIVRPRREHSLLMFDNDEKSAELHQGDVVQIDVDVEDRLKVVV